MSNPYLTKVFHFNAAHQYGHSDWTDKKNWEVFGHDSKIHGHNYTLEVMVTGDIVDDTFANAAFNDPVVGMAAGDSSITPQQLEYEQQLLAHGYTAEQARAYADQHFRPWLNQ